MCKTAAKNIIALEDVETNEFQETTALAFLNKCFCRKIEQQEDLQASTNLKQLKERSTILETIHEIIYYPEKLVIKSVETLTKDIIRETESLADMKNEIFWINIEDCDYQCAIFGLNEEFASNISNLGNLSLQHENLIYFLLTWLDINWHRKISSKYTDSEPYNHEINLIKLGIDPDVSKVIHTRINESMREMQSTLYWAKYHIESFVFSHILISQCHYILLPSKLDTWTPSSEIINNGNIQFQTIDVLQNIEFYKASNTRIITDLQVKQRFGSQQSQIYFHGTTVEFLRDTEDAILRKGIDLGRGHAKQDFSHRDGFYMSDSLDAAIEWGRNKDRKDHCVIVFNIPDDLLDARAQRGLDVSKDHAKFLKVVNYFRNGKPTSNTDFSPNELAEINNARFIKGNIWVRNNEHVFCINNTAVYQLCLKDQDYAKAIENCMCGILFYPNGIP
uniref:Uncharacterized protein n=1 Tax=Biomphalaria glabrata TaxID=6526 RepID=A0A2C9LGQ5_BIOGL